MLLFSPLLCVSPTQLSVLWGWEDGGDRCINNAVLPGNQTRCSRVLCRILKRYLFVHGCHPLPHHSSSQPSHFISTPPTPSPPPLLSYMPQQMSSSVLICLRHDYCTGWERTQEWVLSWIVAIIKTMWSRALADLASLLLIHFFQGSSFARQDGKCFGVWSWTALLFCILCAAIRCGWHKTSSWVRQKSHKREAKQHSIWLYLTWRLADSWGVLWFVPMLYCIVEWVCLFIPVCPVI